MPKCALPDRLVIRHHDARIWLIAAKNYVAAILPAKSKSRAFKSCSNVAAGKVLRKLRHLRGLNFHELLSVFGRHRIAGLAAILDVKVQGFAYVCQRLRPGITLANAPRQRRHADDVAAV